MARLRIRIEMNKGRVGIPLGKLSEVVAETKTFLRMLCQDVHIGDGEWLGLEFENSSLKFNAEYAEEISEHRIVEFNEEFDDVRRGKPPARARYATRAQYAKIAAPLDPDEIVDFGLYRPGIPAPELVSLSKRHAAVLLGDQQEPIESSASVQGKIHSLFLGSDEPHFMLRELSTGFLVKCTYDDDRYDEIKKALETREAILHVYGISTIDLSNRKIAKIHVQRIDVAEPMSVDEFDAFFGCAPNLTGGKSTQEFIDRIREPEDERA